MPFDVPVDALVYSFTNPIDEAKVTRYAKRLWVSDPPAIMVYRRTVDENDIGRLTFLLGDREADASDVGRVVYYVCDGYHRALAAIHEDSKTVRAKDTESKGRFA